jgi:hypothetical protein
MPPPRQPSTATRTHQPPLSQPLLDANRVHPYRDHRASVRTARPSRHTPARDDGRAVAYPDMITVPPSTNPQTPHTTQAPPCSLSTPPNYPHVLTLNAAQHAPKAEVVRPDDLGDWFTHS